MRFPPRGPRIVAVVLGRRNRPRTEAAFRSLHLKAVFEAGSMSAYESHLAKLDRAVGRAEPRGYTNLKVDWRGFGFTKPLRPKEEITFEPLCPRVEIGIHAKGIDIEPAPAELAWVESMVRRYGSDYVSIFRGGYGVAL
jgi:hypothetical protein